MMWRNGLWHNNPALVMLLGLCPLLAVSNSLLNGAALALATLVTLCLSNTLIASIRQHIVSTVRIPVSVLIIAGTVTGFGMVLVVLGASRELIGTGSLLSDAGTVLGNHYTNLTITIFDEKHGLLVALLPPGAFIALGLMLAIKNTIDRIFH